MRELELLQHVYATASAAPRVMLGPGDDMAIVRVAGGALLAAVDQVVGGRHVDVATTTPGLIGRKAVARSLSDIAAMAARPLATLAAVTLPPGFGAANATALFDGMRDAADAFDCPLVGGDIAFHRTAGDPLVCAVTVLAEPGPVAPRRRSDARPGDTVYVTGRLGGSLEPGGGGRHLTFDPRIAEALELAAAVGERLGAMIDVSDGLGRDAAHIAELSAATIEIDAASVPCTTGTTWREACRDGEDYELLFTARGDVPGSLGAVPVTAIGRVVARGGDPEASPHVVILDGGERIAGDEMGWEHA